MDTLLDRLLSEPGLAGAIIVILLLAAWKLYRDLMRSKDALVKAERDAFERLKEAKERHERHYKEAMIEINRSLAGLEKMVDRMFDYLARDRR